MKILVLNASPKCKDSTIVHTALYLQALHPEHTFTFAPAGQLLQPGKSQLQLSTDIGSAEVIDSVVTHELCRREGMNHSTAFYAHVLWG